MLLFFELIVSYMAHGFVPSRVSSTSRAHLLFKTLSTAMIMAMVSASSLLLFSAVVNQMPTT